MSAYTLAEIGRFFGPEGFVLPPDFTPDVGGMRRSKIASYHSLIDYADPDQADAYIRVVQRLRDKLTDAIPGPEQMDAFPGPREEWARKALARLDRELRRSHVEIEESGELRLVHRVATSASLAGAPSESGIRLAITRLERSDAEPEEKVGAAKELVEATVKLALAVFDGVDAPAGDLSELASQLHQRLRLAPQAIAPTTRGAQTMVRILGGLTNIPHGLAELRNEGYGTGHGRAIRISGIRPRHADLAVRAAVAYASFILETIEDPDAPWRGSTP
jgi:hypothetical protein